MIEHAIKTQIGAREVARSLSLSLSSKRSGLEEWRLFLGP